MPSGTRSPRRRPENFSNASDALLPCYQVQKCHLLQQPAMAVSMIVRECLMQICSAMLSCCQHRGSVCEHPCIAAADERDACARFSHMLKLLDICSSCVACCGSEHGHSCACRSTSPSQAVNRHLSYSCSLAAHSYTALETHRASATGNMWHVARLAAAVFVLERR